ncbi:MAG TPA: RDD family protein [Candidatus Dormibacteraeota bacterium]|nr:RDD family protein [Candidatus Dormibacteraeota bacterium]
MAMPAAGNLASPGLRIVQGLIDLVILGVINSIIGAVLQKATGVAGLIDLILDLAYWGYFLSQRGESIGMMVFGMHCRDVQTGQNPSVGRAVLRGFIWHLEIVFTVCIVGLVGWLWMFWDPQRQGWHDKAAGTIVTTG